MVVFNAAFFFFLKYSMAFVAVVVKGPGLCIISFVLMCVGFILIITKEALQIKKQHTIITLNNSYPWLWLVPP